MLPQKPALDFEDEDELELPEGEDGAEDETSWEPDDDSDLEVADTDEDIGLDADTGIDEPVESELTLDDEESGSWIDENSSGGSEGSDDQIDFEDEDELELPEGEDGAEDETSWEPDDDSDLEVADTDEDIGLDADTGIDEPVESELTLDDEESGSWIDENSSGGSEGSDD